MGAITDILHIGPAEVRLLAARYPDCLVSNQTNSHRAIQKYRVIIPNEDENDYYLFLLDNGIAICSRNFLARIESDRKFADTMRARMWKAVVE
jgi:hypothetical protein